MILTDSDFAIFFVQIQVSSSFLQRGPTVVVERRFRREVTKELCACPLSQLGGVSRFANDVILRYPPGGSGYSFLGAQESSLTHHIKCTSNTSHKSEKAT